MYTYIYIYIYIYIYRHILHNVQTLTGRKKYNWTTVNVACREILLHSTLGTRAIGSSALAYTDAEYFGILRRVKYVR